MKNMLISLGLYALLASVTAAAETQSTEDNRACQQENGRFTYDHPSIGKLTDLTQFGLDDLRASAEESTTPAAHQTNWQTYLQHSSIKFVDVSYVHC